MNVLPNLTAFQLLQCKLIHVFAEKSFILPQIVKIFMQIHKIKPTVINNRYRFFIVGLLVDFIVEIPFLNLLQITLNCL